MELCLIDIKSVTKCTTGYLDLAFCVAVRWWNYNYFKHDV